MNLQAIDLNLLVVFEALMEERSVTRAAHRVGLSQPAVTPGPSTISSIVHEVRDDRTRVIMKGSHPIDYRGGILMGEQVILDLANVTMAIDRTVVEIGTAEVARVVIGGLTTSTMITLIIIPIIYYTLEGKAERARLREAADSGRLQPATGD